MNLNLTGHRLEITPAPYSSLARGVIFPLSGSTALSTPTISVTNSNAAGIALSGRVTSPKEISGAVGLLRPSRARSA